jgi:hypothetical protein
MGRAKPLDDPIPDKWIDWDYEEGSTITPKLGVDRDDIPIVMWLPKFLADLAHVRSFHNLQHFLSIIPLKDTIQNILIKFGGAVESFLRMGCTADSSGRNAKSAYRKVEGELSGCINIALWHAIGHTVSMKNLSKLLQLMQHPRSPLQYFQNPNYRHVQIILPVQS